MHIKKLLSVIVLIIIGFSSQPQTIVSGGYISGTWDSTGNPYLIEAPVSIHRDSALYITEGCVLQFYDSAYMNVEGYVSVIGTQTDSVRFTTAQNSWLGIRFQEPDTVFPNNLLFYYCSFEYGNGSTTYENGGAMSVYNRDDVTIFNSTFRNNYAIGRGGAVYLENADIQIKLVNFIANSTSLILNTGKGGAVYMMDSEYILENIIFSDNASAIAGAIYSNNTDLNIRSCSFTGNSSHAGGGALVCHNSGILLVEHSVFENNIASGSGGAIALLQAINARFNYCSILNNVSESDLFLSDGGEYIQPQKRYLLIVCSMPTMRNWMRQMVEAVELPALPSRQIYS